MKRKMKLKAYVVRSLYLILVLTVVTGSTLLVKTMNAGKIKSNSEEEYEYVSETPVVNEELPVVSEVKKMLKPYLNENVKLGKSYYDYKADNKQQENSITYYNGKYIQNSGVDYTLDETFDVVTVLDGTVSSVKQDDLLGNVVEIKHDNNLITTYQSLSEVAVKQGDMVSQGQVIGKSGTNKIDKDMGNHLHFEVYKDGQVVDPNLYVDKEIQKEQ